MHRNIDHPFFRPLWRRAAVLAVCLAWAIVEFAAGSPFWGTVALGLAGYGYWIFIHTYPGDPGRPPFDEEAGNPK